MAKPNLKLPELTPQHIKKFHARVDRSDETGCWPWMGNLTKYGYGQVGISNNYDDRMCRAHRIAYFLHYKVDPAEMLVCHTCDNKRCCNPSHLYLGTHEDNTRDAVERNRLPKGDKSFSRQHPERIARGERHRSATHPESVKRGEAHGMSKLNEAKVRDIRKRYTGKRGEIKSMAVEYGVDRTLVSLVVKNKIWKHVSP